MEITVADKKKRAKPKIESWCDILIIKQMNQWNKIINTHKRKKSNDLRGKREPESKKKEQMRKYRVKNLEKKSITFKVDLNFDSLRKAFKNPRFLEKLL